MRAEVDDMSAQSRDERAHLGDENQLRKSG